MAIRRRPTSPLALAVLALLDERPAHPYEIDFLIRARGLAESIKLNRGSLYTVVEALQRDGLIVPVETQQEGRRPERTVYALTDAGRAEFDRWHRELLSKPVQEYTQFAAGLAFLARIPPTEAVVLLQERARRLQDDIEEKRVQLQTTVERMGVRRLFVLEVEHAVILREAELEWVRQLIREIETGSLDGLQDWASYHARLGAAGPEEKQEGQ